MESATQLRSINPENETLLAELPEISERELKTRIEEAHQAYLLALNSPQDERVNRRTDVLLRMAEKLERETEVFARTITLEMGKTLESSKAEVLKCAACCRYYAENGRQALLPESIPYDTGKQAQVRYEPIGTVLAVMPWNFPFWQVFRCAAPILLSGNSLLLKHASNVPQSARAIESIIRGALSESQEPEGAFSTLLLSSKRVEGVIQDDRIQGVTLTGSEGAGSKVAAQAGKHIKRSVLELGGSDPFIVFPSADLGKSVETAINARLLANGQSCIAAKRFIIHESHYESFKTQLLRKFEALRMGSPLDPNTDLGPLALAQNRDDLHALVEDARKKGARILTGGAVPEGKGFFYPATVIEGITPEMKLYTEEAFGPVASLYRFKSSEEAISIANATPFGLGASIWTAEESEIELCATQIQSGQLFVNTLVASDPRIPFGGVKRSGYGRELGIYGIREWVNVKTVVTA
jgi:succinate-semialdehyde dehydrogenase/glutarate-semialdehyde dehydrogenase